MNDKNLLEMAAKAAGIDGEWRDNYTGDYYYTGNTYGIMYLPEDGNWTIWNPLTDDGDALRLAVKLDIDINPRWGDECCTQAIGGDFFYEERGSDPLAATRRAIVRAAAAIGEKL